MQKTILLAIFIIGQAFKIHAQTEKEDITNIVNQWTECHNQHDLITLEKLYAPTVLFYCKELSNQECVKIKTKALKRSPNFKQRIVSDIQISAYENGTIKCDFVKEVFFKKGPKDFESYLLLKKENENYLITGEGDKITDAKFNYNLDLGKEIDNTSILENLTATINITYILLVVIIFLVIIILVYFLKNKSKNKILINKNENILEKEVQLTPQIEKEIVEENPINYATTNITANIEETTTEQKTKVYLNNALTQTKTGITKLLDTVDSIDRILYGKRMRFFILGSFLVLIIAPALDILFKIEKDWFTFYSTFAFFIFILVLILSLVSSWRDDTGNWSLSRAKSKLKTYFENAKDTIELNKTKSKGETIYNLGQFLFLGGMSWKALQNISVFIRKPIEYFNFELISLRKFEKITNTYYGIPIFLGLAILVYLYNKNPLILHRIKNELRQLLGLKIDTDSKYSADIFKTVKNLNNEFVINAKTKDHIDTAIASSNSNLFNDFAIAIQNWNPSSCYYEYEYQDKLAKHLTKLLPDATIKTEFPIGERSQGNRGRADIVINDTILIEMKRGGIGVSEIQRAQGQISNYSRIWQNKGPVILLLCDYDFEHAKLSFTPVMTELAKLDRPVLTIVTKTNKLN